MVSPKKWFRSIVFAPIIYGLFGSSTPDDFGIPEIVLGCILIRLFISKVRWEKEQSLVWMIFLILLAYPLFSSLFYENNFNNVLRDVIPLFFLFFGLLLASKKIDQLDSVLLTNGILFIGVCFSLRHLWTIKDRLNDIGFNSVWDGDAYYIMEPAVFFAALYFMLKAFESYFKLEHRKFLIYLFLSLIPITGIVSLLLRGKIALIVLTTILYCLFMNKSKKQRKIIMSTVCIVFLIIAVNYLESDLFKNLFQSLTLKTAESGLLNQRDEEFIDVLKLFHNHPSFYITGIGWGGMYDSVTSGGLVRYTHNVFLYFLLKGGMLGLVSGTWLFLYTLKRSNITFKKLSQPLVLSGLIVLLYNIFIEPGYKMLSLGFIIVVIINNGRDNINVRDLRDPNTKS